MKKVTFTSTDTVRKPTHYKRIDCGAMYWKVKNVWYRIFVDGSCGTVPIIGDQHLMTPETCPGNFIPMYGDLVITISGD